jgi:hypothetical protein
MAKSSGVVTTVSLNGQDLMGTGKGLYLDCTCTPAGFYAPGSSAPIVTSFSGNDSSGVAWGGFMLQDTYPATGQLFQQYWFLRDGETGLHSFSRMAYHNTTVRISFLQKFGYLHVLSVDAFPSRFCRIQDTVPTNLEDMDTSFHEPETLGSVAFRRSRRERDCGTRRNVRSSAYFIGAHSQRLGGLAGTLEILPMTHTYSKKRTISRSTPSQICNYNRTFYCGFI